MTTATPAPIAYKNAADLKKRLDELLLMMQRHNPEMTFEMTWINRSPTDWGGWIELVYDDGEKPGRATVYSAALAAGGGREIVLCWPEDKIDRVKEVKP